MGVDRKRERKSETHLFVLGTEEIRMKGGEPVIKVALQHLSTRFVDGIDGLDPPETQLVGTIPNDRAILLM